MGPLAGTRGLCVCTPRIIFAESFRHVFHMQLSWYASLKIAPKYQRGGHSLPLVRTGAEFAAGGAGTQKCRFLIFWAAYANRRSLRRRKLSGYFTLAKIMAKVNRARVSMNTKPKIMNKNKPGRAPGLRAMPSQADAATFYCP
jgi:hypothetical protein